MQSIIEAMVADPEILEKAKFYDGLDESVEGARNQIEMQVECVFNHLYEVGLIEPVLRKSKGVLASYWGPDAEPPDDAEAYRGDLHPIAWKALGEKLPICKGFDL